MAEELTPEMYSDGMEPEELLPEMERYIEDIPEDIIEDISQPTPVADHFLDLLQAYGSNQAIKFVKNKILPQIDQEYRDHRKEFIHNWKRTQREHRRQLKWARLSADAAGTN